MGASCGQTVADVGEHGLLAAFRREYGHPDGGVIAAVGDDAALLTAVGPNAVLTTDMLVQGVDFEPEWATPADVGHKAAAVNLSDLAAMGARPRALLAALALRPGDRAQDVKALLRSLDRVGRRFGAPLVGGDLSSTRGPQVIAVTAIGEVESGRALRRFQGKSGDLVLVSGSLGGAAAGLKALMRGSAAPASLLRRQRRPEPRVALGRALGESEIVRACADISDGLARDAAHLPEQGAGVAIDLAALPIARGVSAVATAVGCEAWELAVSGGEDFELVIAVPRKRASAAQDVARSLGVRLRIVGEVVGKPGVHFIGAPKRCGNIGFDHFCVA